MTAGSVSCCAVAGLCPGELGQGVGGCGWGVETELVEAQSNQPGRTGLGIRLPALDGTPLVPPWEGRTLGVTFSGGPGAAGARTALFI